MTDQLPPDCLLTLIVPSALEEDLLDLLRNQPRLAPGFTLIPAQGMGAHIHLATSMEQVQGRAQRVLMQLALTQAQIAPLVELLRQAFPTPQIAYWATPLLTFGRLGELP
ncbi:MAG TPA: DUF3240 family protein [Alicycliphilus sp.]|nr:DUF3240 family protein [Alicycliphilus sp.]